MAQTGAQRVKTWRKKHPERARALYNHCGRLKGQRKQYKMEIAAARVRENTR